MSYFKSMLLSPGNGYKTYLIQVGDFNETVVYELDKDGNPVNLVIGKAEDTLGSPLMIANPRLRLIGAGPYEKDKGAVNPWQWGFHRCGRWADVVKILNGKSIRTGEARERLEFVAKYFDFDYIDSDGPPFVLTEKGVEEDKKLDAEDKKK